MALDLVSLLGSWENLIIKNNTTTATIDVSGSLNARVKKTYKGINGLHESLPVPVSLYPVIFIELDTKPEEFSDIGRSAQRNNEINFDIVAVTNYQNTSIEGESRENADLECIQLSQNLEALIRSKITLSSTVDWCNIQNVDYSANVREKTYNSISKISIQARKRSD